MSSDPADGLRADALLAAHAGDLTGASGSSQDYAVDDPRGEALVAIVQRLTGLIRVEYVPVWLQTPLDSLDGEKPIDLIAQGHAGARRVEGVLSALEDPGAS